MNKTDIENQLKAYFPKFMGNYVSRHSTNKYGTILIETREWHNRAVQYVYNEKGVVLSCVVIITATIGLNRTYCKMVKSLDELKNALF